MDSEQYQNRKQQVVSLYELTAAGKLDVVEGQLTEDFKILEAESLPYGGAWEGKDALQRLFTHVFGFWDDPSLDIQDILVSENNVIGLLTLSVTSRHNGERLDIKVAEAFHFRGDKICGITPYYFDTAEIAKATGTPLS